MDDVDEISALNLLLWFTNPPKAELGDPGPAIEGPEPTRAVAPRPLPPIPATPSLAAVQIVQSASADEPLGCDDMTANNNNVFPSLDTSFTSRSTGQTNGVGMNNNNNNNNHNNMSNYVAAIPVGHQQDLNYLFQQFQELQAQLANNRDRVNDITRSAEEVARRANVTGNGTEAEYDHEADKSTIRDLQHTVTRLNRLVDLYKHEQRENTGLVAQYEDALGNATEQIRNYCNDIDNRFLAQRRHYNNLLQAEKDEHLQSRLDRDHWHTQTLELCAMLHRANRLRNDEWCDEYRVIVGLQTEVRCFRRVLGLEAQRPEEETGWSYLKDAPFNDQA